MTQMTLFCRLHLVASIPMLCTYIGDRIRQANLVCLHDGMFAVHAKCQALAIAYDLQNNAVVVENQQQSSKECTRTVTPFATIITCDTMLAGRYNEVAFKALDKIVDDASKSGIKLILPLSDNWHLQDGLFQYVEWGGSMGTGDFFTDPKIIQLFKHHITAIVNRTNTLNGRQYKDEPAIFAWDLINELRDGCNQSAPNATCDPSFTNSVQAGAGWHACQSMLCKTLCLAALLKLSCFVTKGSVRLCC